MTFEIVRTTGKVLWRWHVHVHCGETNHRLPFMTRWGTRLYVRRLVAASVNGVG